jgi:phospholipid-binding lipoprotein MlaA
MTDSHSLSTTGLAWRQFATATALMFALGGCATGPNANPRDPFEPLNRGTSQFNEGLDAMVLRPVATGYRAVVPPLVRTGVSNFFGNLSDVWSFVNSALQFKLQNAAENFMRVNINTFFGLGGILDIASEFNIERHKEDFGQTLGRWGMPPGPYLVLPFFGPSTLRDTLALPIDWRGDPLLYLKPYEHRNFLYLVRAIDARSNLLRIGGVIDQAALDKYSFTRDAYLQKRQADILQDLDKNDKFRNKDGPQPDDGQLPPTPDTGPTSEAAPASQPASAPAR